MCAQEFHVLLLLFLDESTIGVAMVAAVLGLLYKLCLVVNQHRDRRLRSSFDFSLLLPPRPAWGQISAYRDNWFWLHFFGHSIVVSARFLNIWYTSWEDRNPRQVVEISWGYSATLDGKTEHERKHFNNPGMTRNREGALVLLIQYFPKWRIPDGLPDRHTDGLPQSTLFCNKMTLVRIFVCTVSPSLVCDVEVWTRAMPPEFFFG